MPLARAATRLDALAKALGGSGRILRRGALVHAWGPQDVHYDWLSSAKPVLSTLLFFAVQEGRAKSVDQPLIDFGWPMAAKDRTMSFRHLGAMTSGYARPDAPGAAWAYNDYAIMLYQRTLFDMVFAADADRATNARLEALGLEDGLRFNARRRLSATARDFGRIAQFWLDRGRVANKVVLEERFFREYCRPQVPRDLPHTQKAATTDYLRVGTYGGESDHFTEYGAGIYGFNWWFNATGRLHPNAKTWPGAPNDTFMSIGARGNCAVVVPSRQLVLVCARGQWGRHEPGNAEAPTNRHIAALLAAVR